MGRLPFDPGRASGATGPSRDEPLTVTEVSRLIERALEQGVASPIRVVGQLSNLRTPGHWYFTLKDDATVVGCVAWASSARTFRFEPRDGDEVVATGHVGYYAPQGRTQFYVDRLVPLGAGSLHVRFQALCDELRRAGYFDEATKRQLPAMPRRVAVITSADSAAVRDVITTARQRCAAVGLLIIDVRVQGDAAAGEIARAIRAVDRRRDELGVDVVIVTRGGGSIEDLWAFNEREVADAAFECGLPLVAAVGHESDTTVIELVADLRASTPTQAAVHVVPSADELLRQSHHLRDRVRLGVTRLVEGQRRRLTHAVGHRVWRDPAVLHRDARRGLDGLVADTGRMLEVFVTRERIRVQRLTSPAHGLGRLRPDAVIGRRREPVTLLRDRLERAVRGRVDQSDRVRRLQERLARAMTVGLQRHRGRLGHLAGRLAAVDPEGVLGRGYSITTGPGGRVIRSAGEAVAGSRLTTRVSDGTIESTVTAGSRRRRRSGEGRSQLDLFRGGQ